MRVAGDCCQNVPNGRLSAPQNAYNDARSSAHATVPHCLSIREAGFNIRLNEARYIS